MKNVSKTQYIVKRGQVWHYHRRVPTALVPVLGRRFVKKSLGVVDLKTAQRRRNALTVQVDAEFAAAEQQLKEPKQASLSTPVSLQALIEYMRHHIAEIDEKAATQITFDPPVDTVQQVEMKQDVEIALQALKDRDNPNGAAWIEETGRKLIAENGASLEDKEIVAGFAEIVRRGLIELQNRKLDRLDGRYSQRFFDTLFDPQRATDVTFGTTADMHLAEQVKHLKANNKSQKRIDKVEAEIALLREAIGNNTPVHQIDDDTIENLRDTLAHLPANRRKIYPNLSLVEAIEQGIKEERRVIESVTQASYLNRLRDILDLASRKQLIGNNPATNVKPIKLPAISGSEKRKPFTLEQIVKIFHSDFYRSMAPNAENKYTKPDRDWRFWVPLIMLLSGARPNEIAQLTIHDVARTPTGTWYLNVIDAGDEEEKKLAATIPQSAKNEASRRRIPLHPELIKIGFLDFCARRRKEANNNPELLFKKLKPNKYGNHAWYISKRFNEVFLPAVIKIGQRQALYSLRHSCRDALRRIKAPPETLRAIAGWSPAQKSADEAYGDPGNPDFHIEWVEKISYPGLDLSFLYTKEGLGPNDQSGNGWSF